MQRGRGGVEYEDLSLGGGALAERGSVVETTYTLSLNRGDVVQAEQRSTFQVGRRRVAAGLEYGVEGMRVGGVRRIRFGPQLGYRDQEVPGVPANAVLDFMVKLLRVAPCGDSAAEHPQD